MSKNVFICRIDSSDAIISVSDNWCTFADANAWGSSLRPEDVVKHNLWEFIQGSGTRLLYQELFRRARLGITSRTIPFRCDSPGERRYLELIIGTLPDGHIEITSRILRTEPRRPVSLLDADTSRSEDFVTVCSMCKRMRVSPGRWAEIEDGLADLRLFEADAMPQLTHGLCHSCYRKAMGTLGESETPGKAIDSYKE